MKKYKIASVICLLLAFGLCFAGMAAPQAPAQTTARTTSQTAASAGEGVDILLNGSSALCDSDAVVISGAVVTIRGEGTFILTGELHDGMIIVDADKSDKVSLVLNGVSVTSRTSAPIYVKRADKVFITTADGTNNVLSNGGQFIAIDENNIDSVIFSKDDLTLNGLGSLSISSLAGHGVVSKDDLVVSGGNFDIKCSNHGLSANDSVKITGGSLDIDTLDDALHSNGSLSIAGGEMRIAAGDDGIHADGQVSISGGTIDISQSKEGIEGLSILISGGNISVVASDDALNAAGGVDQSGFGDRWGRDSFMGDSGASVTISGGVLNINAYGDGIDSNGSLTVTGGETYVSGPENRGNGAIDSLSPPVITGGVFVAAGAMGMAQGFGSSSEQGAAFVAVDYQVAGSLVTLTDERGNTLISWRSPKLFDSVAISCPEMVLGGLYTLTAGSYVKQFTLDEIVYSEGGMGDFGMGGRGGWRRGSGADRPGRGGNRG